MKDGSSKLSASYGRFYYAIPTDLNVRAYGAQTTASSYNFDPLDIHQVATAPRNRAVQGGASTEPVQDGIKGIYQDEATLGFDKAIDPTFSLGVRATYRTLGRTIEDRCDFDPEFPEANGNTCVIINPGSDSPFATGRFADGTTVHTCDGRDYPPYESESGCSGPQTTFVNVPAAKRQYFGLEFVAKKQLSSQLWAQASYIFSSLRGNYDGAARIGDGGSAGQTDPGINADYDYPLFLKNAYGKLILDRPHSFRLDMAYSAPFGLTVGFQGYIRSGAPKSKLLYFNSIYGTELYLNSRGSDGREPVDYDVNLSLAYAIKFQPITITLFAQGFNLLNRQQTLSSNQDFTIDPPSTADVFQTTQTDNPEYNLISIRKNPRKITLGARVSF